jgi:hypothetical protein
LEIRGLDVEILQADEKRITLLRLKMLNDETESDEPEDIT